MSFADFIKDTLASHALSQEALANLLGVSQRTISAWIHGEHGATADSLLLIYEKFGVTPNEALGIEEVSYKPLRSYNNSPAEPKADYQIMYETLPPALQARANAFIAGLLNGIGIDAFELIKK